MSGGITQQEADRCLKIIFSLYGEHIFRMVFHDESKEIKKDNTGAVIKDNIWALPSKERTYYVASSDNVPVLFVGANWGNSNNIATIASVARVTKAEQFFGKSVYCFKRLMTDVLHDECGKKNKTHISAMARTEDGNKFFNRLRKNLPDGFQDESLPDVSSFVFKVV